MVGVGVGLDTGCVDRQFSSCYDWHLKMKQATIVGRMFVKGKLRGTSGTFTLGTTAGFGDRITDNVQPVSLPLLP